MLCFGLCSGLGYLRRDTKTCNELIPVVLMELFLAVSFSVISAGATWLSAFLSRTLFVSHDPDSLIFRSLHPTHHHLWRPLNVTQCSFSSRPLPVFYVFFHPQSVFVITYRPPDNPEYLDFQKKLHARALQVFGVTLEPSLVRPWTSFCSLSSAQNHKVYGLETVFENFIAVLR